MAGKVDDAVKAGRSVTNVSTGPGHAGSGPAPGVIEVNPNSVSTKALQNYNPKPQEIYGGSKVVEYIYVPSEKRFIVGNSRDGTKGLSPHQQLVEAGGVDDSTQTVVGGMFSRADDGTIVLDQNSGHYHEGWTDDIADELISFLEEATGNPVKMVN